MRTKPIPAFLGAFVLGVAGGVSLAASGKGAGKLEKRREETRAEPRKLHASAAMLAISVLGDSALEHYRGSFENPGMFAPLISSALALFSGAEGATFSAPRMFSRPAVERPCVNMGDPTSWISLLSAPAPAAPR